MTKLLDSLLRYEHRQWIKLHKLHVGVGGLLLAGVILTSSVVIANKPGLAGAATANKSVSTKQRSGGHSASAMARSAGDSTTNVATVESAQQVTPVPSKTQKPTPPSGTPGQASAESSGQSQAGLTRTTPTPAQPSEDYPDKWKTAAKDTLLDDWGMYNRESTSYTAWKVSETFGDMPTWGMTGRGDARYWPANAVASGIGTGSTPKVHSVAIQNANSHGAAGTGFSAWVESVSGNQVTVSAYNFGGVGSYLVYTVPASNFDTYVYFGS